MPNNRTLQGLYAAVVECVPGRAQRNRLLAALARVPGNREITAMTAALAAREAEGAGTQLPFPGPRPPAGDRIPPPPRSGVFRTRVIPYTQAAPEVQVTMSKETARTLLAALEGVYSQAHLSDTPTNQLYCALKAALEEQQRAAS